MAMPNFERLLNVKEAEHLLNISRYTLNRWIQQRRIPYYRLGRRFMFSQFIIQDFVSSPSSTVNNVK
jgi:excisionase family DNA binding protein